MKLSTRGRYATRAMCDLAMHFGEGPIMVKDISKRQYISERYLEQILTPLKLAGLVRATRGSRGGFALARPPSAITLLDIIYTVEGSTAPVECVDDAQVCPLSNSCAGREVWSEIKRVTDKVLESTTLQHLLEKQKRINAKQR